MERPIAVSPTSNWSAGLTYPGGSLIFPATVDQSWIIPGLVWSAADANVNPLGAPITCTVTYGPVGNLTANTLFSFDITSPGPGFIPLVRPLKFHRGYGVSITFDGIGDGLNFKASVLGAYLE